MIALNTWFWGLRLRVRNWDWAQAHRNTTEEEREEKATANVAAAGEIVIVEAAAACLHLTVRLRHRMQMEGMEWFCFVFFLQQRQFNKLCLRRLQSIRPRNQQESFYRVAKTAAAHKKGGKNARRWLKNAETKNIFTLRLQSGGAESDDARV